MIRSNKKPLQIFYYANIMLVLALVGHQAYLHLSEPRFESVHAEQVAVIRRALQGQDRFEFAVVGNVKNSARVFQDHIIPQLNGGGYAFMVSAGNAVSSGDEENYRAIYKVLENLEIPYLLTFGEQENSDFGDFRFYQYFGPHFYSFVAGNSHFIFLDGTGKTASSWQLNWLERELSASSSTHRFVFIGLPVHDPLGETPFFERDNYLPNGDFRAQLRELFRRYQVDLVFSANITLYEKQIIDSVGYVTTGGAGGLIVDSEKSFHHYVAVSVRGDQVEVNAQPVDVGPSNWLRTLESIWSSIYSFFYVSLPRFLLLVGLLTISAVKLQRLLVRERDYYPDYEIDPTPYLGKYFNVAMFSNNYFPFVSGVSVSIHRLKRGLEGLGDRVLAFVPEYEAGRDAEPDIVRLSSLYAFGGRGDFPLANLFLPGVYPRLKAYEPDVVHVHHPFWLGSLGLWLGKRLRVPVVYTYHTRLERYAHYVPLPGRIFRNLISHYLIKRFSNKCDGIVVPTYSAEDYLRIIGVKSRILVQPTGVDFARYQEVDSEVLAGLRERHRLGDQLVLVSASRLGREKNIDFMLDALAKIKPACPETFKLLLIGDGPDRPRLEARIAELGLEEEVCLVGAVPPDEMAAYYQLGDVFVFASKSETQGMVILEAMSAGLPVVAVRSSGIDDVVKQNINGFKTRDNRQTWAQALLNLMTDAQLRLRLSRGARDFARDHDVAHFAEEIHEFYAYLLAEADAG